jgi:negative regulator of flagellin synthesis FlgM
MKIGPLDPKTIAPPTAGERKGAVAPAPDKAQASAQVDLSASAALHASEEANATFDSAKVERIAQAIRDGKFSVNAEAIADKLIVNAEELLGRKLS